MTVYPDYYKVWAYLNGAWVDLTSDCVKADIRAMWGMMGNTALDRLATTGRMYFQLNNVTGKYFPDMPGTLAGWTQNVPVKLVVTFEGLDYIRFRGTVDKIDITTGLKAHMVYVTALDWMDYAAKYPLKNLDYVAEATADDALGIMVPAMPIPPQLTDYDTGVSTFPALFDTTTTKTKAYTEFSKLTFSEVGYIYLRKDAVAGETLVFEGANYRHGLRTRTLIPQSATLGDFLLQENGDYLLQENLDKIILDDLVTVPFESDNSMTEADITYGDQIINQVTIRAYPKRIDEFEQVLYRLNYPMKIGSGETIELKGNYSDPEGGSRVTACPALMLDPNAPAEMNPKLIVTYTVPGSPGIKTVCLRTVEDTYGSSVAGATNYSTETFIAVGEMNDAANSKRRAWMRWPGLSDGTIPATATVITASLWLYAGNSYANNDRTFYVYRPKRAWILGQVTWNSWKTGSTWTSAGGFNAADCEQTDIGSCVITSTATAWQEFELTPSEIQDFVDGSWANNGLYLKAATEADDAHKFKSSRAATTVNDYKMYKNAKGTGTDKTADLTVVAVYNIECVNYTLTNNAAMTCWITKLQARGIGMYSYNPIESELEDAISYNEYGLKPKAIEQQYQQETAQGVIEGKKILENYREPKTTLNKVIFCANRSVTLMEAFLNLDVGDLISIKEDDAGIDNWYYIQSVEFTIGLGGVIMFGWKVIAACSLLSGCLSPVAVEFGGGVTTDMIDFGYVPNLVDLPLRSYSVWIYPDAAEIGNIMGFSDGNDCGELLYFMNSRKICYQKAVDPGGVNIWTTTPTLSLDNWHHVVITQDISAGPDTDPIIYLDSVVAALTEVGPGAGSAISMIGNPLQIGNIKTPSVDYTWPFPGIIIGNRIYDDILIQAEVDALFAAGRDDKSTQTDHLIFQGCNIRTKDLTYFTDHTMLDGDRLIDNIYGIIGAPHGNPVTRLP